MLGYTGPFILLLIGLSFVIFVHELGHYLVAKWVGIKVERFSIGFGPVLLRWKGKNAETEWCVSAIPLGGYVKMLGQEDLNPNATSPDPRAYNNKPIWARMAVVSAGVIMNLIFAVVFFVVAFLIGVAFPPAQVGGVVPESPAARAPAANDPDLVGLKAGDVITAIDGDEPSDFTDVKIAAALSSPGEKIRLDIRRPGYGEAPDRELQFHVKPERSKTSGMFYLGIEAPMGRTLMGGAEATAISRFYEKWGLRPGMTLSGVNDKSIASYWQFREALDDSNGRPITLTFTDDEGEITIDVEPQTGLAFGPVAVADREEAEASKESAEDEGNRDGDGDEIPIGHLAGLVPATQFPLIVPGNPADGAIEPGDLAVRIGDVEWPTHGELKKVIEPAADQPLEFVVRRDGQNVALEVTPESHRGGARVGVQLGFAFDRPAVVEVLPFSPFAELNWPANTRITSINGHPVEDFTDIRLALQGVEGETIEVTYRLPFGEGIEESATVALDEQDRQLLASLADLPWTRTDLPPFEMLREVQRAGDPLTAVAMGFDKTGMFMKQTYVTLIRLFQQRVPVKELRGPVGIIEAGTISADRGWSYLLFFLGLISVALAVFNFLPIPIVDGGLFVMLIIEKIRGEPLPERVLAAVTYAGLVLLGGLVLVVTYHDIQRLITGG